MVRQLRHRQAKAAETIAMDLTTPRHTSTLHFHSRVDGLDPVLKLLLPALPEAVTQLDTGAYSS
jgi:hypothetical protein